MRLTRKLMLLTLIAALTLTFAYAPSASAKMVKKVDNFIIFLDHSGSMGMKYADTGKNKIDLALDLVNSMNEAIPDLDFTSGFYTFAPFNEEIGVGPYNKAAVTKALGGVSKDFAIFGRRTPMGDGQVHVDPVIGKMNGKTALIAITDGDSNTGSDPVQAAKMLREKYGDNLCVHIISLADTPAGQQTIDRIRAIFPCSVSADYASLMAPGAMTQYAKDVFYEDAPEPAPMKAEPAPKPEPAPAPVPMAKETISFDLKFGFDKSAVTDDMTPVLEEILSILQEDPSAKFTVAGHTDSSGPEAYNQALSERRAASIVDWLTKNGVDASRLEAKGYGESMPKFDNSTVEGRKLNRRVELESK